MTKNELEKLKSILLEDKKRIESEAKSLSNTDFGSDTDSGDEESDETEAIAANYPIDAKIQVRLRGINKAIEKIENGTYGICESCKKEISVERLEAKPEATVCMNCASNE